jgi:hypothetical protein
MCANGVNVSGCEGSLDTDDGADGDLVAGEEVDKLKTYVRELCIDEGMREEDAW